MISENRFLSLSEALDEIDQVSGKNVYSIEVIEADRPTRRMRSDEGNRRVITAQWGNKQHLHNWARWWWW